MSHLRNGHPAAPQPERTIIPCADWHAPECECPTCRPGPVEDYGASLNRTARAILLGFAIGLAICALLDLATGARGVALMFGGR